ncbi:MAG TPA: type II toxin-antitoxin system HicB family antitoxin [Longimicrobiaceae bacterium]|nr:type II toxin-antitoxin system HicB family antitoxin [Longimicrobiaceae bacterium]
MKRYLIVVERTETGFSAYSPDLPGCASTGRTREEVQANMREAIAFVPHRRPSRGRRARS